MTTPAHWNIEELKAQQAARRAKAEAEAAEYHAKAAARKPASPEARQASVSRMAAEVFAKTRR